MHINADSVGDNRHSAVSIRSEDGNTPGTITGEGVGMGQVKKIVFSDGKNRHFRLYFSEKRVGTGMAASMMGNNKDLTLNIRYIIN